MQARNLAVHLSPGISRHLAGWLSEHDYPIDRCWLLLYPQAVDQGLAESLRLQLLDAQTPCEALHPGATVTTSPEVYPIAIAPDGLLTIEKARACCELIWSHWHEAAIDDPVLIAIGGGSVMDLAKLVRWFPSIDQCEHLETLHHAAWFDRMLEGHERFKRCSLILMPTTSGTGSEATAYATVWGSTLQREKLSFTGAACYADAALIDYELTLACPYSLTRDCGLDALSHALDALWNRRAEKTDRDKAIQIASHIVSILPELLENLHDRPLRKAMSEAAHEAGHLIAHTQTSLIHALSYPLTSEEDLAHGLACAQWIAAVAGLACERHPQMLHDLNKIWAIKANDGDALMRSLSAWLSNMGVASRQFNKCAPDLRLQDALNQTRGKNFLP